MELQKTPELEVDAPDWEPLEHFLLGDFMFMGYCQGRRMYKHYFTRRYLHLDTKGRPYWWVEDRRYEPLGAEDAIAWAFGIGDLGDMLSYGAMKKVQTLVQLSPDLLAALDQEAASSGRSRSDIIREAIANHLKQALDAEIDRKIVKGYRKKPQGPDEWAEAAAREAISAEPW